MALGLALARLHPPTTSGSSGGRIAQWTLAAAATAISIGLVSAGASAAGTHPLFEFPRVGADLGRGVGVSRPGGSPWR